MVRSRIRVLGMPFHPTLVVFPSALFPLSFLTDAAAVLLRDDFWWVMGFWVIAAGVAGTVVAVVVGLLDYKVVPEGEAKRLARHHRLVGILILALYAGLLALHRIDPFEPAYVGWTGLGLNFAGQIMLTFQGHWGGKLVYRHRVGVEEDETPAPPSGPG